MFGLSKPIAYGLIAAVSLAAIAAIWFTLRADLKQSGQQEIINQIEKENGDAASSAEERRTALRDCIARNGVFNFATGTCHP